MKRCTSALQACGGSVGDGRRFVMRSADNSDPADLSIPGGRLPRRGVQGAWEFSPRDNLGYAGEELVSFGREEL